MTKVSIVVNLRARGKGRIQISKQILKLSSFSKTSVSHIDMLSFFFPFGQLSKSELSRSVKLSTQKWTAIDLSTNDLRLHLQKIKF